MILEVTSSQVAQLSDGDLRALVAYLCERDLCTAGQSPAAVTWGGHQNAPDGGLDVRIQAPVPTGSTYIPRTSTGFQVKAQKMASKAIAGEMAPKGVLRPAIIELARVAGAYIIVSSKDSASDKELTSRKAAMLKATVTLPQGSDLFLDFYDSRRIASWVNQHRPLVAWVHARLGAPLSGWHSFDDWSSAPAATDAPFLLDDHARLFGSTITDSTGLTAEQAIQTLRELLRQPRGTVRLVGLSGVGKTRLIQALFDERVGSGSLSPQDALYTDISNDPQPMPLEMLSRLISDHERAVLIVDNCGVPLHRKLAEALANSKCTSSLITVEYDISDDEPAHTTSFKLLPASTELIDKLLELRYSSIALPSRRVIAAFSEGNARVAFALAETAKNGQSLLNLSDSELFHRLFDQQKDSSSALLDAAKVCALLYSFNGEIEPDTQSELAILAALVEQSDKQVHKHVAELHRRQLVQKRGRWRAILPHPLANRLAKLALEDVALDQIEQALVVGAPDRIVRSFSRRVGFLHDHDGARAIARKWLRADGRLAHLGALSGLESQLFENIAPVCPVSTLALIELAAEARPDFFLDNANKQELVRVLRALAYDPSLFERSVSLLKRFGAHESGQQTVASDSLNSLFWLCLSGTNASAAQRAAWIFSLLAGKTDDDLALGTRLLGEMLRTTHFSSHYSFEFGAWKRDFGFYPRTAEEVEDWYAQALAVARKAYAAGSSVLRSAVRHVVAVHTVSLVRAAVYSPILETLDALTAVGEWPEAWIAVRTALRRGEAKLPPTAASRLAEFERHLRPSSLIAMVRSYALSPEWTALDVADSDEHANSEPSEARERVNALCTKLGRQLATERLQLDAVLSEIIQAPSTKTAALGAGLASACESVKECWATLTAGFFAVPANSGRSYLLEGFLSVAYRRSQVETEELLDAALRDERLHRSFIDLQASVSINERAGERILAALRLDSVPVDAYVRLAGGRAHEGLTDPQVSALLRGLSRRPGGKVAAAQILGMRVFGCLSDKLDIPASLGAICREFLREFEPQRGDHLAHLIGMIVTAAYCDQAHESEARAYCVRILASVEQHQVYAWDVNDSVTALAKAFPLAVLDVFVEQALSADGIGALMFDELREGRSCALEHIPPDVWIGWVKKDVVKRSRLLARSIRFAEFPDMAPAQWSAAASTLIELSPAPESVLEAFYWRFSPRSWSGSLAIALAKRKPLLDALKAHPRESIRRWANSHAAKFAAVIAAEQARESSESRAKDQAFE